MLFDAKQHGHPDDLDFNNLIMCFPHGELLHQLRIFQMKWIRMIVPTCFLAKSAGGRVHILANRKTAISQKKMIIFNAMSSVNFILVHLSGWNKACEQPTAGFRQISCFCCFARISWKWWGYICWKQWNSLSCPACVGLLRCGETVAGEKARSAPVAEYVDRIQSTYSEKSVLVINDEETTFKIVKVSTEELKENQKNFSDVLLMNLVRWNYPSRDAQRT